MFELDDNAHECKSFNVLIKFRMRYLFPFFSLQSHVLLGVQQICLNLYKQERKVKLVYLIKSVCSI